MRGRSRDDRAPRRRIRRHSSSSSSDSDGDGSATRHGSRGAVSDHEVSDHEAPVAATAAVSFEHLEAIRGVVLLTRNEYPLAHLPREKLFKPDDAFAECGCPFPGKDEPEDERSRCEDVSCLNFATYIECSADQCDAGMYCRNQRLQHPERFPELEAFKTQNKGFGVRARTEIAQNSVIGEYVGEIIDEKELQRRLKGVPRHELNFYYLALEPGVYIDARNKGSFTRFMNHSCEPNCKTEKWTVKGETRIAVIAQRAIQEREELTFDYQWKSLGSMQIKCYCGSANCKGVIGSEVDATKTLVDNGPRGFYRDPIKEESGEALVGRHLRLFSPTDTSVYTIATVRGFNPSDESYELEYGDSVGTPQDDSFDSPLSAIDDLRSQPFVKLSEHSWQIFVELSGLSEDQIEEAVFAIPKRRHSGPAVIESDSPRKLDHTAASSSPPHSFSTPSSTPGPGPATVSQDTTPSQEERRDHEGELLDADGDIVTTKLLIKGLPPKCDEALLRRLFLAPRNSRSSSLLERLQASVVSQRTSDSIVLKLDLFFFDDTSGWALIEFADSSYPKYFRKNLNSRALSGQALRVFLAGRREVENFERAKRNNAIRREEQRATEARSETAATATASTADELTVMMRYPYGHALDWLVSIERVEDSPSRRKGTSAALEEKLRSLYVQLITNVATNLRVDREDTTSAILALHRYYSFFPMQNVEFMAAGMLHIYLKAHGRKFSWTEFVSQVYASKYRSGEKVSTVKLKPESDLFKRCERQILETELELLEGLLFDISSENPYALMDMLTSANKFRRKCGVVPDAESLQQVPSEVQREVKRLLGLSFELSVWAHTPVECVVLSILYVGAAVTGALVYSGTTEPFATCLTPAFLPILDPVKNEKDALALLDCSLFIVDSFKDRWLRLDKNAKAAKLAADRADPNYFDTEQFAVQRHKPVEVTQRITMLLKAWIDVKGSLGGGSEVDVASNLSLMTIDDLKRRRRTGSFNVLSDDNENESIKASEVLRLEPAPKGGQSDLRKPPRLHVSQIEAAQQVRKRTFAAKISASVEGIDIAEKPVFLLPWPYREHEPVFSERMGVSHACARELSTSLIMPSRAPKLFLGLTGIVFPDETSSNEDFTMDIDDGEAKRATQLRKNGHYCAYEMPLHMYTGILDAKVEVPMQLRKKVIYDMLSAVALCHEWGYVHRYVAPCNLFVFRDGVRLGGYHAIRKLSLKTSKSEHGRYELSDSERKEHCHGSWLQVTPPEVLLGDRVFTTRGDVWSVGCVALMLLFDRIPLLQGADMKAQVNLIFRICGTPSIMWAEGMKLPQYAPLKPKHEYKMRLRKTLLEHRQDKGLDVPTEAIDVLEAMLQLDPSKRSSAKKLLDTEYFAEFRRLEERPAVDFSSLPPTFDALQRKLEHQLMRSSSSSTSKRRRVSSDYERPGSASSADSSKSRRHSGSSSRKASSASKDDNGDDDEDFVPLPEHFHDTVMADATVGSANGEHESASKRRATLGWGMGLNS